MKELNFRVDGSRLTTKSGERVTTGNIEFVTCNFQFDTSWKGLVKTAVFYQPRTPEAAVHMILDATDSCYMPLLKQSSELHIGVFGIAGDIRATTNFCVFAVIPGSYIEGMGPAEPSRDVYEQLMQQVAESLQGTRENAAAAAQSAANAKDSEDASAANVQASADQVDRAKAEADRSEAAADRASEIAGGDVVTKTEFTAALVTKINTVPAAPAGNVPVFAADGQIKDSGRSAASIGDGNVKSVNSQTPDDAGNVSVNTLAVGDTEPTDPNVVEWIDTSENAETKALEEIGAVVQVPNPVAGNVAVLTGKGGIADGGTALSEIVGGLQDVNVQLGNKVNVPQEMPNGISLNDMRTPGEFYKGSGGDSITDTPYVCGSFSLKVEFNGSYGHGVKQTWSSYNLNDTWTRALHNEVWMPWQRIATATPPQEYDLPLAAGWSAMMQSTYCKTQEDIVNITFKAGKGGTTISAGLHKMATLPVGFRPSQEAHSTCTGSNMDFKVYPMWVLYDGGVYVMVSESISGELSGVMGGISFTAKN